MFAEYLTHIALITFHLYTIMRDSLFQTMIESKFSVKKEVRNLLNNGTEKRPADIENSSTGRVQCLDVSIVWILH